MESKVIILWRSKKCAWQNINVQYGKLERARISPIKNTSDNCNRSVSFILWKLVFKISYARARFFNQNRKLLFRERLWKFYQLFA